MTNEERRRAFALRLAGRSWAEIGRSLGYSGGCVRHDLLSCLDRGPRQPNIRYPVLRRYVMDHCDGSVKRLAQECGVSANTLYSVLRGISAPQKSLVDKLLYSTGLTYEQAFQEE